MAWQEVCEHADGLIALWGGEGSLIAGDADPAPVAKLLKEAFGDRLYALIARHHRAEEREEEARTILRAGRLRLASGGRARGPLPQGRQTSPPGRAHLHPPWAHSRHGRPADQAE